MNFTRHEQRYMDAGGDMRYYGADSDRDYYDERDRHNEGAAPATWEKPACCAVCQDSAGPFMSFGGRVLCHVHGRAEREASIAASQQPQRKSA